jgi:hypothetical protein
MKLPQPQRTWPQQSTKNTKCILAARECTRFAFLRQICYNDFNEMSRRRRFARRLFLTANTTDSLTELTHRKEIPS